MAQPSDHRGKRRHGNRHVLVRFVRVLRAIGRSHRLRAKETDHQRHERMVAQWTRRVGWFTLITVVVTAATAWILHGQQNIMQGTLNLMAADERPWVSINGLQIDSALSHDAAGWQFGDRWHIKVTYRLKNYGKTPATHVIFWAHVVPIMLHYKDSDGKVHGTFMGDALNDACAWPEGTTELAVDTGETIFPGEESELRTFEVQGSEKVFAEAIAAKSQYTGIFLIPVCVTYRSVYANIRGLASVRDIGDLFESLGGIRRDESRQGIFGNDRYRTAQAWRLGKSVGTPIDLSGERVGQSELSFAPPGFQGNDIR